VNEAGETELGTASNVVTVVDKTSDGKVSLTGIPISTSGSVTARKIYRTFAEEEEGYFLLTTIADNTTTIFTDNIADANLPGYNSGFGASADNQVNSSFGKLFIDGTASLELSSSNCFVGQNAGAANTTGYRNIFLGYNSGLVNTIGHRNIFLGYEAGQDNTAGIGNAMIGYQSGFTNIDGNYNSFFGYNAGYKNTEGSNNVFIGTFTGFDHDSGTQNVFLGDYAGGNDVDGNKNVLVGYRAGYIGSSCDSSVFIGYQAGYYETGDNKLFIDNVKRTNEADGRIKALIYGVFDAATANQKVTINGLFNLSESKTPASASATGVKGDIAWDASYIYICTATDTWKRTAIATW